jgi:multiple antibiotic resistance protein
MLPWSEYIQIIIALIVIIDPIGAIPIFVSMTADFTEQERRHTAYVTSLSVSIILVVSFLVGHWILKLFGINIASFRVGGGILLLLMSISMMHAKESAAKHTETEDEEAHGKEHIAVVPLAIPLLAGPGAISLSIIYAEKMGGILNKGFLLASCVAVGFLMWGALRLAMPISKVLGKTGINIVTRIMGLILAAIAVQFIASGAVALVK